MSDAVVSGDVRKPEYKLLSYVGSDTLEERVNELLADDWVLHGSPFVITNSLTAPTICQALVRIPPVVVTNPFVDEYTEVVRGIERALWPFGSGRESSDKQNDNNRSLSVINNAITSHHFSDAEGNPAGGTTFGRGFAIGWQNGPLGRGEVREDPNGAFVEDIIKSALDRLEYYQRSRFASDYNELAIISLKRALEELNRRTADRENRGVEGTHRE